MLLVFMLFILMLGVGGFQNGDVTMTGEREMLPIDGISLLVTLMLVVAAVGTVFVHQRRLVALILMGAVGLGVVLVFVKFSAPDLALTQLSVEVVTMVLLLLALYFLPQRSPVESSQARKSRDAVIAIAAGGGVAALIWAVLTRPHQTIADYFLANSVSGGGGTNVVNVILVDFRGYDTLGEITVLAIAGLGIYAMLDQLQLTGSNRDVKGRLWSKDMHPAIMASLTRLLLPLALLVSMYILLRGHNMPGGGFIAGLITAVALIMQYLANGVSWTRKRLPANEHTMISYGLLIATLTGLASWFFGYPFLTSTFSHIHWPLVGEFELASAMAFDLGVYLVVVGATLLIIINLGLMHSRSPHSSARKHIRKWKH